MNINVRPIRRDNLEEEGVDATREGRKGQHTSEEGRREEDGKPNDARRTEAIYPVQQSEARTGEAEETGETSFPAEAEPNQENDIITRHVSGGTWLLQGLPVNGKAMRSRRSDEMEASPWPPACHLTLRTIRGPYELLCHTTE
ncbi:hypothetical protein NDU88_005333 [Pleurodeles waltl]|uniref:Uncharacterized protein n=1 Tax=Pleurodeles waltl TaxID=8319 RepID=A0AAV7UKQ1_PLEWA|nr:hypothetical protein NDU88_005333 [Pleurodeles waltl]